MTDSDFERKFEYGVAMRAIPEEKVSGDHHLIRFHPEGALFAVVDGAGHGSEAASAAAVAVSVLQTAPPSLPGPLLNLCHQALRSTRGAAISLAFIRFSDFSMRWAGIGNVEVVLLKKSEDSQPQKETLLLRNGVVGYQFSQPRDSTVALGPGDMLIFATDGVDPYFLDGLSLNDPCQAIAESIMSRHAKSTDDALALVIRVIKGVP